MTTGGHSPAGQDLLFELTGKRLSVVDAHHHLWDLGRGHYPWLQVAYDPESFMGDYRRLCVSYDARAYLADLQCLRVAGTVHVEAERARDEALAETAWLRALAIEQAGVAAAIVPWIDLWAGDVAERIDAHIATNERVRAVRCKPRLAPADAAGGLRDPQLSHGLQCLIARDLAWDLRVPWSSLGEAHERLRDFPELRVVINHAGLPWDRSAQGLHEWRASMAQLARLPRAYVKLSEFSAPGARWDAAAVSRIVATVLELFGAGRCMFASNLPVSGLTADIPTIVCLLVDVIGRDDAAALRAVFRDTACEAYRIDPLNLRTTQ